MSKRTSTSIGKHYILVVIICFTHGDFVGVEEGDKTDARKPIKEEGWFKQLRWVILLGVGGSVREGNKRGIKTNQGRRRVLRRAFKEGVRIRKVIKIFPYIDILPILFMRMFFFIYLMTEDLVIAEKERTIFGFLACIS